MNGCGSFNSDMDLCLCLHDPKMGYETPREYVYALRHISRFAMETLERLTKHLVNVSRQREYGFIRNIELIRASVPIIRLQLSAPYEELEIDMNCNNVDGIYNSHLIHYYSQ